MSTARQTVLVTGASSGIGVDLAFEFAKRGYDLILLARREDRLIEVKDNLLRQFDVQIHVLTQDLIEPDMCEKIQAFLDDQKIRVDILVNNAGFGLRGNFHELPKDQQLKMIHLNVSALTDLTHHFLPSMIDNKKGGILNVASVAAFQPGPNMSVYFATKAFVLFLSEGLHEELKPDGIHVSALCPGPTESEFGQVANMHGTKLFDGDVMKSDVVARIGVDGFFDNQAVVIPGMKNNALAFANRLAPRSVTRKIAHYLQK